ncbi:outer membrane protein assembly factor BamB family protein [Halorientalis regularis]|uniref:PQQ-like domain-containing protein n=1 Tax=Halorientalis regularis TaxID=660518 RepID=A0A1G7KB34_9EURY|nr:PQQ-binding-like beta-propeller repeat protein [Halorientalis regularis]SDF34377.1 PQQ-like domain-containing protein [Halorientalis regularis]
MGLRAWLGRRNVERLFLLTWVLVSAMVVFTVGVYTYEIRPIVRMLQVTTVLGLLAGTLGFAVVLDALGLGKAMALTYALSMGIFAYLLLFSPSGSALVDGLDRLVFTSGPFRGAEVVSIGTIMLLPPAILAVGSLLVLVVPWTSFRSVGNGGSIAGASIYAIALIAVFYFPLHVFYLGDIVWAPACRPVSQSCYLHLTLEVTLIAHIVSLVISLPGLFGVLSAPSGSGPSDDRGSEPTTTDETVADWPMAGHDTARTGAVPGKVGPVSEPGTAWQRLPDGGSVAEAPVVDDGTVYAVCDDDSLLAVDLESGAVEWTVDLDGEASTPPVVTDRLAVVGTDDGVVAVHTSDGEEQWTAAGEITSLVAADEIYAGTTESVLSLSKHTGRQQWRTALDARVTDLAVGDGTVYAATRDGIVAVPDGDGDARWSADAPGRTPRVSLGSVVVASGRDGIRALDPETGDERWCDETSSGSSTVAVAHGRVYQTTVEAVRALDEGTGDQEWRTLVDATTGPSVVGETLYVGTDGDMVALDTADAGAYEFTHPVAGAMSAPAVVGNALVVHAADGSVTCATGELAPASTADATAETTVESDADGSDSEQHDEDREAEPTDADRGAEPTDTERDEAPAATAEPTTTAERFADDCPAFELARVLDDEGPVHFYDGRFVDEVGVTDAGVYVLAPDIAADEAARSAFTGAVREWQSISKNPHIATVYGSDTEPRPWVAFDSGTARLDEAITDLDGTDRFEVVSDLAEAIRTAGLYNFAHGGLTPEAVFLTDGEDRPEATVAGWGVLRDVRTTTDGSVPPTPYTAPEQLDGDDAGSRTDVYRLGAIATQVLTGDRTGERVDHLPRAIRDGTLWPSDDAEAFLSPPVAEAIREAMAVDPDERIASPYDFKRQLRAAIEG